MANPNYYPTKKVKQDESRRVSSDALFNVVLVLGITSTLLSILSLVLKGLGM